MEKAMPIAEAQMAPPAGNGGKGEFFENLKAQFEDPIFYLGMAGVLVLAVFLAAAIAYHPSTRRKASSIEEIEQPKTFIMYALVGALVGYVVMVNSVMAFVVFGIGGLLRFRTDVGQAKDTGRVILATIIGICCGLGIIVVAVLATIFGWFLIWYLESQEAGRVQVKGLKRQAIPHAADAYREVLLNAGCEIFRERKNFLKGQVSFVFKAPRDFDREGLEDSFDQLPEEVRGSVDWDIT